MIRFKVTSTCTSPRVPIKGVPFINADDRRIFFVYGRNEAQARTRLPEKFLAGAVFETAGHVENGVLHLPDEEVRAAMASTQDDRRAPGA